MTSHRGTLAVALLAAAACGPGAGDVATPVEAGAALPAPDASAADAPAPLVVLEPSYARLVDDFNAAHGRVRVVTVLPPT